MCAGTISHARIRRVYFGASDEKGGAVVSGVQFFNAQTCHHAPEVYSGIGESPSAALLKKFFEAKRDVDR
jgi:tRNA(Arg) A34 adenosine deaminase TadA